MAIAAAAATAYTFAQQTGIVDRISGWLGGSSGPCANQPDTADVAHMMSVIRPEDRAVLAELYARGNEGRPLPSDPYTLAHHMMGGDDCKATRVPEAPAVFVNMVQRYRSTTVAGVSFAPPPDPQTAPPPNVYGSAELNGGELSGRVEYGRPSGVAALPWYAWAFFGLVAWLVGTGRVGGK